MKAAGFEHSVANMYFIPVGLLVHLPAAELDRPGTGTVGKPGSVERGIKYASCSEKRLEIGELKAWIRSQSLLQEC